MKRDIARRKLIMVSQLFTRGRKLGVLRPFLAEAAAKRWLAAPSKPQKHEPPKAIAPTLIEHVKINFDDVVSRGLERDPRFLKLYWHMKRDFRDRNFGREVCLHEAGHSVLMEQDGMTNVRFMGPDIVYDLARNDFVGSSARVIADDQPNAVVDEQYIFKITQHMAAGGMTLRKIGNIEGYVGDDADLADFARKFAHTPPNTLETPEQFWKRAQDVVAGRLDEPVTKRKVLEKAQEYFYILYPRTNVLAGIVNAPGARDACQSERAPYRSMI
jgi:hypothetical protein